MSISPLQSFGITPNFFSIVRTLCFFLEMEGLDIEAITHSTTKLVYYKRKQFVI